MLGGHDVSMETDSRHKRDITREHVSTGSRDGAGKSGRTRGTRGRFAGYPWKYLEKERAGQHRVAGTRDFECNRLGFNSYASNDVPSTRFNCDFSQLCKASAQ